MQIRHFVSNAEVTPRTDLGIADIRALNPLVAEADSAPCKQLFPDRKGPQVCPQDHTAWCSKDGADLACCVQGTVPFGREGSCGCAPGNVREADSLAIQRGCTLAKESDELQTQNLSRAVFKHLKQLKQCMESNLDDEGKVAGTMVTKLLLGPTGHVLSARIAATSLPSPPTSQCLLNLFRTIEFPPPRSGWDEFTYPIQLLSQDDAQGPENKVQSKGKAN